MALELLDPTLDITFKLLLLRNPSLLRDMIESVVELPPIHQLDVLNPEIPKEFPADKTIVLDIRVRLYDGRQIDLEMQSTFPPGTRARFLYYWAKTFSGSLANGEAYTSLRRCISILWFRETVLKNPRFHSIFRLREVECDEVFSPEIEFHVMELPKLALASLERQARLERWARFLKARALTELEALAREDAMMDTAKHALEELSSDAEARRLAEERETAVLVHRHLIGASFEEGEAKGRAEGEAKGRAEGEAKGLLTAIETACSLIGFIVDAERKSRLVRLNPTELARLLAAITAKRAWPDEF